MIHVDTTPSGAYEWSCTQCSRRILLRWPPHYEKLVLDRGDDSVPHAGGTGGLQVGVVDVTPRPPTPGEQDHAWLNDNGIDWDQERPA
jgi:hypothetical protein